MDPSFYAFATPLLLGVAALVCLGVQAHYRKHLYLRWLAAFLLLLTLGLTAQLLMTRAERFRWVLVTTTTYLLAIACLVQALALRLRQQLRWAWWSTISSITLAAMWYYSKWQPNMNMRLVILSMGAGLLLLLALWQLRHAQRQHLMDRATTAIYGFGAAALLCRPLLLLMENVQLNATYVQEHITWGVTSLALMVLCTLFTATLCASPAADIYQQLRRERNQDALTGLLTRRAFQEACAPVPAQRGWHSFVFCDIDHFKSINDQFGHATGDAVLRQFGQLMHHNTPHEHLAARIGGEEFVLALREPDLAAAQAVVAQIQQRLQAFSWKGLPAHRQVTASFGIATVNADETLESAMQRADRQLYAAKHAGRNRACSDAA